MNSLAAAVDRLYEVFACYSMPDVVEMSPYRDPEKELGPFRRTLLRQLKADELNAYAFHALTTVGSEALFKYALPRLLELVTNHELLTDAQIVFGKLRYSQWTHRPEREQDAMRTLMLAWWRDTLKLQPTTFGITSETALCSIAQAEDELTPYLALWLADDSSLALVHLAVFLGLHWENSTGRLAFGAFWNDRALQAGQVADWLSSSSVRRTMRARIAAAPDAENLSEEGFDFIHDASTILDVIK
ncbi:hypothetical protein [Deinococcus sp.]|uniref:hypothetical protein n=1 Tax=Deinococcus sp. TaxID=47478 RepID=UPI003B598CE0